MKRQPVRTAVNVLSDFRFNGSDMVNSDQSIIKLFLAYFGKVQEVAFNITHYSSDCLA
jgi:hypothetical protein